MSGFGKRNSTSNTPALAEPADMLILPSGESPEHGTVASGTPQADSTATVDFIRSEVLQRIEPAVAVRMTQADLTKRVNALVAEIATERRLLLNRQEQGDLGHAIVDDMVGLGPLEPLLRDTTISDILINGSRMIYVERRGKLQLTGLHFRSDAHVLHVAQRIASAIGRRIDESSPMLDARLADGSRVNVIISPLSVKGPCISIRKFSKNKLHFPQLISFGTISPALSRALEILARCRMNIIISGGTGSGKTTLLNALSSMIDPTERIITIEDTAELQLQQQHVVQLESRPPNLEGNGEITQRDLMRNALRMRPDRIIVGEVRGSECFDMMQAMNTGHDGSMGTVHANSARDAFARMEDMMLMAAANLPIQSIRAQMTSAIDVVIQTARMRDGIRRVTEVAEIAGSEGEMVSLSKLFVYSYEGENSDGTLRGAFVPSKVQPRFLNRLEYFGLADAFMATLNPTADAKP